MPKIRIPRQKGKSPTRAGAVRMPAHPNVAGWEGTQIKRMGRTLSSLGGELGTLALNVQALAIREEANQAVVEDTNALKDYGDKLRAEGHAPLGWGDAVDKKFTEISTNRKFNTKAAKKRYDDWATKYRNSIVSRATIGGMAQAQANYKGNLSATMIALVDDGQTDEFFEHLDFGLSLKAITEDETLKRKKSAVELEAMNTLMAKGLDAAISHLRTQDRVSLNAVEQSKLIGSLTRAAKRLDKQAEKYTEEMKQAKVVELFGKLDGNNLEETEVEANSELLELTELAAWKKIQGGQGETLAEETDWKKYLDLEMKLFAHWNGNSRAKDDKLYIHTEMAKAHYADRYIDEKSWAELQKYLTTKIPAKYLGSLSTAFEQIVDVSKAGALQWWQGPAMHLFLSGDEAKGAAMARRALFEWVMEQAGRNKDLHPDDVLTEARKLAVVFRQPEARAKGLEIEAARQLGELIPTLDLADTKAVNQAVNRGVSYSDILKTIKGK